MIQIRERACDKDFPAPMKISLKEFRWDETDIETWLEARKEANIETD